MDDEYSEQVKLVNLEFKCSTMRHSGNSRHTPGTVVQLIRGINANVLLIQYINTRHYICRA